jgi:DNA repair protein RecO (recombination protein O)
LGLAVNCARFLEVFRLTPDGAATAHRLFTELLNSLEGQAPPSPFLPVFFRARLTISQGYAFSPGRCSACGQPWEKDRRIIAFYAIASGMLCPACAGGAGAKRGGVFRFQADELGVLHQVLELPLEHWTLDAYSEKAQRNCAGALDGFLRYHLGLGWESDAFRPL